MEKYPEAFPHISPMNIPEQEKKPVLLTPEDTKKRSEQMLCHRAVFMDCGESMDVPV